MLEDPNCCHVTCYSRFLVRLHECLQHKASFATTSNFCSARYSVQPQHRAFCHLPRFTSLTPLHSCTGKLGPRKLCCHMNTSVSDNVVQLSDLSDIRTVYVYRSDNPTNNRFDFDLFVQFTSPINWITRLRLSRSSSESVSVFLERLAVSLNKAFEGKLKRKSRKLPQSSSNAQIVGRFTAVLLESSSDEESCTPTLEGVDKTRCLSDLFLLPSSNHRSKSQLWLHLVGPCLETKSYKILWNPARVLRCRLSTIPMVGCPIVPFLEMNNASLTESEFLWFVTRLNQWPTEPCHTGLIFTPGPEHFGCRVRLNVCPRDESGQIGVPFGTSNQWHSHGEPVECVTPIVAGPKQKLHAERLKAMGNLSSPREFRVLSYNLLADMYCSMEGGRRIFRHCPEEYLDRNYRLPLILRELLSFNADFLCLQEVDVSVFHRYLKPALRYSCNMDGLYLSKRKFTQTPNGSLDTPISSESEKGEGCAIFYRTDRFELIEEHHLPSLMLYAEDDPCLSKWLKCPQLSGYSASTLELNGAVHEIDRQNSYSQCLTAALFRMVSVENGDTSNALLLIGSTHFYFSPSADFWRYIQACAVRQHLNNVANRAHQQIGSPVCVVLCGDINQQPDGPAFNALLDDAHSLQPSSLPLRLHSAYTYDQESFTNWVPGFKASLDVILYSADSGLKCIRTAPLLTQDQIVQSFLEPPIPRNPILGCEPVTGLDAYALPNKEFPSDHTSLVADFHLLYK